MKTTVCLALVTGVVGCSAPEMNVEEKGATESGQGGGGAYVMGTIFAEGMGANIRAGASTSTSVIGGARDGATVRVECWTAGESIEGNPRWDYLPSEGGYVSDALVQLDGAVPECGDDAPPPNVTPSPSPAPSGDAFRRGLVAEARKYLGIKATGPSCNPFTPQVSDASCRAWCADFLHVVWRDAGADVTGINGTSASFYQQAVRIGRWKSGAYASGVLPGDAVVWANETTTGKHVGMVTAVNGDAITVIHGNFWKDPDNGSVYESTLSRSSDAGTGAPIIGYASPRAR